ncbi:MAG: type II toxin-antitoxin system RelE/ParE family toxin [Vulcanimicrobiota bacterium]
MENKEKEWELILSPKVERKIRALPADEHEHVTAEFDLLITAPERADVKAMKGRDKGKSRQRIGKWRAVFRVDTEKKIVWVTAFGARGDVYKK